MHLGSISQPCCINAPRENQRLLNMVKLLVTDGPSVLSSMCHSKGLNLLTKNSTTLTCKNSNIKLQKLSMVICLKKKVCKSVYKSDFVGIR